MRWLTASFYDFFMASTEAACLGAWRREILSDVGGRIVEIGAGTGANIRHYPQAISELIACEPDDFMRQRLEAQMSDWGGKGQVLAAPGEALPIESGSMDFVVSTLVCCTVASPENTLSEAFRVLKPGGHLVFLEHVAAIGNPGRLKWQKRIEPLWKLVAGNCHLTRPTVETIHDAGFILGEVTRASMRKAPPFVRPTARGWATKPT